MDITAVQAPGLTVVALDTTDGVGDADQQQRQEKPCVISLECRSPRQMFA